MGVNYLSEHGMRTREQKVLARKLGMHMGI